MTETQEIQKFKASVSNPMARAIRWLSAEYEKVYRAWIDRRAIAAFRRRSF